MYGQHHLFAARFELLEHEGVGMCTPGIPVYAVTELKVKYRGPIRLGDRFIVTTYVATLTAARCTFSQRIIVLNPADPTLDAVRYSDVECSDFVFKSMSNTFCIL